MTLALALVVLSAASSPECPPVSARSEPVISTEESAVTAARDSWKRILSTSEVQQREPYRAELKNGVWHVYGELPSGWRGGTPEAQICASNGKVLRVFHSQ